MIGIFEADRALIVGLKGNYIICASNVAGRIARRLDAVMDDGNTDSGVMMISTSIGDSAVPAEDVDNGATYLVCLGV